MKSIVLAFIFRSITLVGALAITVAVSAEKLNWLYRVDVPVDSQSDVEIANSIRDALNVVLIRVTGELNLNTNSQIRDALQNAQTFHLQNRFSSQVDPENPQRRRTIMNVQFDPDAVNAFVLSLNLPVWTSNRPSVLALFAIQEGSTYYVQSSNLNNKLAQEIEQRAMLRGVPLVLPLMDARDRQSVAFEAVVGQYEDALVGAQRRYNTAKVAIVKIEPHVLARWRVRVYLYDERYSLPMVVERETLSAAVTQAVDNIADMLATQYAVIGEQGAYLYMSVVGVSSILAYHNLMEYLREWEFIERVDVATIEGNKFSLRLLTPSTMNQLRVHLANDLLLVERPQEFNASVFEWMGAK